MGEVYRARDSRLGRDVAFFPPPSPTSVKRIVVAAWLPDGKEFVFGGQETGRKWRV